MVMTEVILGRLVDGKDAYCQFHGVFNAWRDAAEGARRYHGGVSRRDLVRFA